MIHFSKSHFFHKYVEGYREIFSSMEIKFNNRNIEDILNLKIAERRRASRASICGQKDAPVDTRILMADPTIARFVRNSVQKAIALLNVCLRTYTYQNREQRIILEAFNGLRDHIVKSTELGHKRSDCRTCLFTALSDKHWAAVLYKYQFLTRKKKSKTRSISLLSLCQAHFLGPSKTGAHQRKRVSVEAMTRTDYISKATNVSLYMDHFNLVYIYDSVGQIPGIAKQPMSRMMR